MKTDFPATNHNRKGCPLSGDSLCFSWRFPKLLGTLKLWKRKELMAEVSANKTIKTGGQPATYRFTLNAFEAGTPFHIELEASAPNGNNTTGMIFLRKVD